MSLKNSFGGRSCTAWVEITGYAVTLTLGGRSGTGAVPFPAVRMKQLQRRTSHALLQFPLSATKGSDAILPVLHGVTAHFKYLGSVITQPWQPEADASPDWSWPTLSWTRIRPEFPDRQ
ncbi:uncharacterized protein [Dermacentor albipictus]|uniref:uncharacterized protein n=1 Tax=Dermacentor albipictus TaxID=60249 RepID=UPI0038FCF784